MADWDACPPGSLRQLADFKRRQHLMAVTGRIATGCVLLIAVAGIAYWTMQPGSPVLHGGLTCAECRGYFEAYHQQLAQGESSLSAELFAQVGQHLSECKSCQSSYDELYPTAIAWLGTTGWQPFPAAQTQAAFQVASLR